jgi:hypothetical protein
MGVTQTATIVSKAGLVCPHEASRESVPRVESHSIRAR